MISTAFMRYTDCMKASGIIAEFNPFHDGHAYLIRTVRHRIGDDILIVILSSCFTSRGLPSLMLPEVKTRKALEAGADLVIALPAAYAMQSADYFAGYAVEALHAAGISSLYFGSESADLAWLEEISSAIESQKADPSTSLARNAANIAALRPNDLLAAAYLKACRPYGIACYPILRDQSLKSATYLRKAILAGDEAEDGSGCDLLQTWKNYYPYLRYMLLESDPKRLEAMHLVSEGIENRLIKNALLHETWDGFLEASVSKTYSRARIQRVCMMILLQISETEMKEHDHFETVQILGLNERGRTWLNTLPETTKICSRFRDLPLFDQKIELKSRRLYSFAGKTDSKWKVVYAAARKDDQSEKEH